MNKASALIVDDEPDICELLELTLKRMDINTFAAGDLKAANKILNQQNISICLTDMRLPDGNGIDLVKKIQKNYNHIPVAIISAHGNMDTAIEALKAGAFDFVSKPLELAELRNLVKSAIKLSRSEQDNPHNDDSLEEFNVPRSILLGRSAAMTNTLKLINKLSKSQAPVYISGESGTGKELAAKQIHHLSARKDAPFVPVNCGAIPRELVESEFFGHKKGSFTGAIKDKQGLFKTAHGGTLFLDEIADLPLSMQVKLLRAIQEKSIRAVGDSKEEKIDVRIISATHKNLAQLVSDGLFRQDLYYRINVIELQMPPLREREDDCIFLANHFLSKLSTSSKPFSFAPDAENIIKNYTFPGNVRELENMIERAIALSDDNLIKASDLNIEEIKTIDNANDEIFNPITADKTTNIVIDEATIKQTLEQTRWNRKEAAKLLGLSYRQFRYKLKKLGIE